VSEVRRAYPLRNADADEAARLDTLQHLRDASTIRHLERLGVGQGWRCAELGAGGGSIARWLADRVGPTGSVTAIDADTSLFVDLGARPHVSVVEDDLVTLSLGTACFDLVHSRAVLMHLTDPDTVVDRVAGALAPGGVAFFEEVDGAPAQRAALDRDLPPAFRTVLVPMAAQWTWARTLAARLASLGLVDVVDDVLEDELAGATPSAAFWVQTLETVRPIVTDRARMAGAGRAVVDAGAYDEMIALLSDPAFSVPFTARHRVFARRPAGD
jgi:2-polyprenyl-3-methyl-5-hydroxy-6-metoxy-1,4-benzoquinol methylase